MNAVFAPLVVALALSMGCAGGQKRVCTPETRAAIKELYVAAVQDVIGSGACDKVQRVEHCAAYMVVETHYVVALRACD